jgi:hypothetical protein
MNRGYWLTTCLLGLGLVETSFAEPPKWLTVHPNGSFSLIDGAESKATAAGVTTFCSPELSVKALGPNEPGLDDWGPAEGAMLSDRSGHQVRVVRRSGIPFTMLEGTWSNSSAEGVVLPAIDVARIPIDLGLPLERCQILGTGGLTEATKPAGSYMWMAVADPTTRAGIVVGWLTGERGSGVVLPSVVDGRLVLTAKLEYGRLSIDAGKSERLDTLVIGRFEDARLGLEAYADAVARFHRIKLLPQPCGYCTWYHAGSSNADRIAGLADFAARELAPFGFSVVQIDDGWQAGEPKNGPRKNFTTHRATGPFPNGMKQTAEHIASRGLTPGIWFMPFAGTWNDPFFKDRADWFAKTSSGEPFETNWGGTAFDMTRPEAQAFLQGNVERLTREWGYRYLKMDGLFTGSATKIMYVNDAYREDQIGETVLFDAKKTHVQALRDGLRIVRRAAGPDVFLLGCCAPQNMRSYGGAFGLVDAMRIGPDNAASVEHLITGPRYGSRNYFLHGRVWWNDPDPVYVRRSLSQAQSEVICSWAGVTGQLTITSDELERLPAERLDIVKRIMPSHGKISRPVDLFDRDMPRVWVIPPSENLPGQAILGVFNWESAPVEVTESIVRTGLPAGPEYAVFDFWSNRLLSPIRDELRIKLGSIGTATTVSEEKSTGKVDHCCAVLAVRAVGDHPQVLSTSRHVTQGGMDVVSEAWDKANRRLSGTSRVVANDPYELRLLTRSTEGGWKIKGVEKTRGDGTIEMLSRDEGDLARVMIRPTQSGLIDWRIQFEKDSP